MYDSVTLLTSAGIILVIASGIAFGCSKRYELAVFLIFLSPWVSSLLLPNAPVAAGEQEGGIGGYIRISLVALIGAIGVFKYLKLKSLYRDKLPIHFIFLALFLLISLISITYSIDQNLTGIKSLSFLAVFGFLLGLNSFLNDRNQVTVVLNVMFIAVCFCLILNLMSVVILPEKVWAWNNENRFQGLAGHPNTFGSFCMISYPVLLWKHSRCQTMTKWLVIFAMIAFAMLHVLTGSRTSIVVSVLGILTWLLILKKKRKFLLMVGVIPALALLLVLFKPSSFDREESSSLRTFTGRDEIWRAGVTLAMEKPILGYGFEVSGKIFEDPRFYMEGYSLWSGSARSSLHNGYLSVVIGLGLVGFIPFCILLFIPFWLSFHAHADEYKAFVITIILMCVVTNFFESAVVGGSNILSVIFWITWVIAGRGLYFGMVPEDDDIFHLEGPRSLEPKSWTK
jgi:O-antigen ligase